MKIFFRKVKDILSNYCSKVRNKKTNQHIVLFIIIIVAGVYAGVHWFSTIDEDNQNALEQQAEDYFGYDELYVVEVEKRGNYLAVLCTDESGNYSMCVFERDWLFKNRCWAVGGKPSLELGKIYSWNSSGEEGAVLIFCGRNIPNEICWYKFQNSNITYTCPVEDSTVLDIFIITDTYDINGYAIPLDSNHQEIK